MALSGNQRFKDVLFALSSASRANVKLGRLQLQKLIYLADVFSAVWRVVSSPAQFRPDSFGPYDPAIQNAVDALVFRGIAQIGELRFGRRYVKSTYSLSAIGTDVISRLVSDEVMGEELSLYDEIATEINKRGWNRIRDIVYAEPTYCAARAGAESSQLRTNRPNSNQTVRLARLFDASWSKEESQFDAKTFVQIMFLVFDEYRTQTKREESLATE
jgi:uncharacterized protein YwgA